MADNKCAHLTLDLHLTDDFLTIYDQAEEIWPKSLPGTGTICKTLPYGYASAPRFSQCCTETVYNITEQTTPDDPAYPASCVLLCRVDPVQLEPIRKNPGNFSELYMCLTNEQTKLVGGDIWCGNGTREYTKPTSTATAIATATSVKDNSGVGTTSATTAAATSTPTGAALGLKGLTLKKVSTSLLIVPMPSGLLGSV